MTNPKYSGPVFYTYILYSISGGRYYIGQTNNISDRVSKHNGGFVRSTKPFIPWNMVGCIEKTSRSEAMLIEKKLKNLNTEDLKKFLTKYFPNNSMD